jgi:hypothetical protein
LPGIILFAGYEPNDRQSSLGLLITLDTAQVLLKWIFKKSPNPEILSSDDFLGSIH